MRKAVNWFTAMIVGEYLMRWGSYGLWLFLGMRIGETKGEVGTTTILLLVGFAILLNRYAWNTRLDRSRTKAIFDKRNPDLVKSVQGSEEYEVCAMLDYLTDTEGAYVTVLGRNPDAESLHEFVGVDVCAGWTAWDERRFLGKSRRDALQKACFARRISLN